MENNRVEITSRKLEKLVHFLAAFESGREIAAEYYDRFIDLVESVDELIGAGMFVDVPDTCKETMRQCKLAAQEQNSARIMEMLPAFCDALQAKVEEGTTQAVTENDLNENLIELKNALIKNDTTAADTIMKKIAALKLSLHNRELYFDLYDLLMDSKTDEALERIEVWLKF